MNLRPIEFSLDVVERADSLIFTLEYRHIHISFLYIVKLDTKGNSSTDLFKKETDASNYLHIISAHLLSCNRGISYGHFLRVRRICSSYHNKIKILLKLPANFLTEVIRGNSLNRRWSRWEGRGEKVYCVQIHPCSELCSWPNHEMYLALKAFDNKHVFVIRLKSTMKAQK